MRTDRITQFVLASFTTICVMYDVAPAQQEVIPNDPYFKDQVSFKSPGGKIVLNQTSTHPSPEEFNTHPGIDLNIAKAWAITTGSKNVVVAILDDGFCYTHPDFGTTSGTTPAKVDKMERGSTSRRTTSTMTTTATWTT